MGVALETRFADSRPVVMGILNLTPDSFSDGLPGAAPEDFLDKAFALIRDGAEILDIGAESTRPGAAEVPEGEEWARLEPFLKLFRERFPDFPLSLDTRKTSVARAAIAYRPDIINDTSFAADPGLPELAARNGLHYVLMHSRGTPRDMAFLAEYGAPLPAGLLGEFAGRLELLRALDLPSRRLILDPGFGFAKTPEQCRELMDRIGEWPALRESLGCPESPLLIGVSRKRFLQLYVGECAPAERDVVSAELSAKACWAGFGVVRTHNPALTRRALCL